MPRFGLAKCEEGEVSIEMPSVKGSGGSIEESSTESPREYRLYKRRWIGLLALVVLNIVTGMALVWFGPIANAVVNDFGFTLDQINWFGNVVNVVYPASLAVPYLYGRLGLRRMGYIGSTLFVVSGWVRYAGTARSLSKSGSLALIMVGQLLAGLSVPIFQVIVPSYSERWFDLKGRTTATMIMGLANPVGNALGQLIPPLVGTTRQSLLVMAIIYTVAAPFVFLVGDHPPTPPTFAATHKHPSMLSLVRAMLGKLPRDQYTYMTVRQRMDFTIMILVFGILVGIINAFTILTAQQLGPYGYSSDTAGFMGAALLLVGLVAAAVTAPLYDRVFTHHLALSCKLLTPIMAACWIALIWEIKPNNDVVLYILMAIIGATSLSLLPVVLELAVELTRNADGSSAILWLSTNLFGLIFVLVEGALRAGPDADPPLNMHRAVIFQASLVAAAVLLIFGAEGKQTRRTQDELKRDQAERAAHEHAHVAVVEVPSDRDENSSPEPAHNLEKGESTLSSSDSPVGPVVPDGGELRVS
ncbi:MFS general substrate transporter [Lentinus tigrinus ALCF2SS1-7]|uniref:MFS general substrate transporter n=1 Tax=Lentinus tigrinus ALCF2SS1-7 TaxID=1328758 RepID=UPI001165E632|nr:MFS general substrate transporter [Lentinus tigrinus ALCF2SS1-7]